MLNLSVMCNATFPTKPGKRKLRESWKTGQKLFVPNQTFSERRSYERRSERRSQFHERKVSAAHFSNHERKKSAAHFSNHERKKSAAHFSSHERKMSAKVSKERKKSAENKFSKKLKTALIKIFNFPFINSIKASNYISCR